MTKDQKLLHEYQASGLSIKPFAAKIGKTPSYVQYRLQKARAEKQSPNQFRFVPLDLLGADKSVIRIIT